MSITQNLTNLKELLLPYLQKCALDFLGMLKICAVVIYQPIEYLFSFSWINDLLYRINTLPTQIGYDPSPSSTLDLLDYVDFDITYHVFSNPLLNGCFNAFLLCLPLTVSHFYGLVETAIYNRKVGRICLLGTFLGTFAYTCFLKIQPSPIIELFAKSDSLGYLASLSITCIIIYKYSGLKRTGRISQSLFNFQLKPDFKRHFLAPFVLAWVDQIIIFPYLHSVGDPFNDLYEYSSINNQLFYILGSIIGGAIAIPLVVVIFKGLYILGWKINPMNHDVYRGRSHFLLVSMLLGFVFTSVPYYALDYLSTGSIGLHSNEKVVDKKWIDLVSEVRFKEDIIVEPEVDPIELFEVDERTAAEKKADEDAETDQERTTRLFREYKDDGISSIETFGRDTSKTINIEIFDELPTNQNLGSIEQVLYRAERDSLERDLRMGTLSEDYSKSITRAVIKALDIPIREEVAPPVAKSFKKSGFSARSTDGFDTAMYLEDGPINSVTSPLNFDSGLHERLTNSLVLEGNGMDVIASSTGFSFVDEDEIEPDILGDVIKSKYYKNKVYKTLLKGDINLFLANLPKDQKPTSQEFGDILAEQKILEAYNNSIRQYLDTEYDQYCQDYFDFAKGFSNKLVSHQATGNYHIVRRLFRLEPLDGTAYGQELTFNGEEPVNYSVQPFLSYDQPLYTKTSIAEYVQNSFHEELEIPESFDEVSPLISTNPIPFYAGWDGNARKYVISSRYIFEAGERKNLDNVFVTTFPTQSLLRYNPEPNIGNTLSLPTKDTIYQKSYPELGFTDVNPEDYLTVPIVVKLHEKPEEFFPPDRGYLIWHKFDDIIAKRFQK